MSEDWKGRTSFVTAVGVPHSVGEGEKAISFTFYPISMGMLGKIQALGRPLVIALTTITSEAGKLTGSTKIDRTTNKADEIVTEQIDSETLPSGDLFRTRLDAREGAAAKLVETLTNPSSLRIFAQLVFDSLRDEKLPKEPSVQQLDEWLKGVDLPIMVGFIGGVLAANAGAVGPLFQAAAQLGKVLGGKAVPQKTEA